MVDFTANAVRVLEARYLRRDAAGRVVETPDDLFHRVARGVAHAELLLDTARDAEQWEGIFHRLLASLDFLPNSPTLMNAGTPLGQLAACFVLPVDDTIEGIFTALRSMALVQRSGGGTGFSFSVLRPRGDPIASTGGEASGPVSFMRVFDCATESIKLGGRRRGANMAVLSVTHPDVLEFVDAKREGAFRNFNLSVAVTDAFMEAVSTGGHHDLVHPASRRTVSRLDARAVFDRIVDAAWDTGDPGLLFIDAVNRDNPTPALGSIETTNPCGEVPLLPWESCVLGSVNLARMVDGEGVRARVDWELLRHTAELGVRFLDDVLEVTRAPLPEIAEASRATRKIGLGVMGFAEFLLRLGVPYDAPEAAAWADRLMAFIADVARGASRALAEERGVFPAWAHSRYAATGERIRHATRLSVAPTGTLSLIAGTTTGIEPLFALAYRREHTLGGPPFVEVNPIFLRHARAAGLTSAVIDEIIAAGSVRDIPGVPESLRRLFVTATGMSVDAHLAIQAAFQRHVDNAVSKTVNLPDSAGRDAIAHTYLEAWRLGLKGITVYRTGAKPGPVLTAGANADSLERFAKCDPDACRVESVRTAS